MELSVTRWEEFDLDEARFGHRRNKTGQKGEFWLPNELVKLLRKSVKASGAKSNDLAFLTRNGEPLVGKSSDAARQAYDDWRRRCAEAEKTIRDEITFYSLRTYFGHRAAIMGGASLRDAALSHSAKTPGAKYYSNFRDFDKVGDVGRAIYADLCLLGMFAKVGVEVDHGPVTSQL